MGPARALLSSHSEARLQWNRAGTEMFLEAGSPGARVVRRVPVAPRTLAWGVPVRLTRGLDRAERAAVSPDGRRLAFSSVQSTTQAWLFPFDADRGTPPGAGRPLTDEDATVANLALSPDGSRLYFVEERPGQTAGQGVQLDLGTGERTRVAKDVAPIPSRSGRLSYLISRPSSATGGGEEFALAVHEAAGRERLIAPWGPAAMHPSAWGDGDDVVLATRTEETYTGPASLVEWPATALATAPRRVVLSSPATQFWQGQYSPDGRWIGFVALDLSGRGTLELGVVPARGAPASTWARLAGDHRWPDKPRWSPDGRTL
jgi:dipeptidyl aminopeptidase/acylaminoacyl peptidase